MTFYFNLLVILQLHFLNTKYILFVQVSTLNISFKEFQELLIVGCNEWKVVLYSNKTEVTSVKLQFRINWDWWSEFLRVTRIRLRDQTWIELNQNTMIFLEVLFPAHFDHWKLIQSTCVPDDHGDYRNRHVCATNDNVLTLTNTLMMYLRHHRVIHSLLVGGENESSWSRRVNF